MSSPIALYLKPIKVNIFIFIKVSLWTAFPVWGCVFPFQASCPSRTFRSCRRFRPNPQQWSALAFYLMISQVCPQCGGELTIIAFLTESVSIKRLLIYIVEPVTPAQITLDRGSLDWLEGDFDQMYP